MRHTLAMALTLVCTANAAAVLDRIAVIVGKHVVKLSDIDRDLRVTEFLNREPLSETPEAKHKSADRLVDQQIIREELATGGYGRATDEEADAMLKQIRQNRYGNSDVRLKQALTQYGISEDRLRAQLLWQLTVLHFIDERFRTGVPVTDEEVRTYYDQHPAIKTSKNASFETMAPKIRTTLEGEQVNTQFDAWLSDARKQQRVEFRDGAFQ